MPRNCGKLGKGTKLEHSAAAILLGGCALSIVRLECLKTSPDQL